MVRTIGILLGLAATVLLGGCGSDDPAGSVGTPVAFARVRAIHAVADAPNVNFVISGAALFGNLAYKEASGFAFLPSGTTNVRIDAHLPGGLATVLPLATRTFGGNDEITLIAAGEVATLDTLVISEPITPVAAGSVRARIVHAAPHAPAVDVYVTAPSALLAQSVPLGSVAFGDDLDPVTVQSGDYRIRVTLPNAPGTVVFDSGTVALPSGGDLFVLAVENTGVGAAPLGLLVVSDTASHEIVDAAAPAEMRVIHASPDAPAVDVVLDDDFANPILEGVAFPAASAYFALTPGTHAVKVTAANNAGAIVIDANVTLAAGLQYSVFASGTLAGIAAYVLADDRRSVATAAKVRVVHTAPSAGAVDVYVTTRGASIATATPAFRNVTFRSDTGYANLAAGAYDIAATAAGTKTVAIAPVAITVVNGGVYTAAARDAAGGGGPLGLILLDDFP